MNMYTFFIVFQHNTRQGNSQKCTLEITTKSILISTLPHFLIYGVVCVSFIKNIKKKTYSIWLWYTKGNGLWEFSKEGEIGEESLENEYESPYSISC